MLRLIRHSVSNFTTHVSNIRCMCVIRAGATPANTHLGPYFKKYLSYVPTTYISACPVHLGLFVCICQACGLIEHNHSALNVHGGHLKKNQNFSLLMSEFEFIRLNSKCDYLIIEIKHYISMYSDTVIAYTQVLFELEIIKSTIDNCIILCNQCMMISI